SDGEGGGEGRWMGGKLRGLARDLERAREARERRPEREYAGKQPLLVDAERSDHIAVLRGGAHEASPARTPKQQPQRAEHRRPHRDKEEIVLRESRPCDLDGTREPGCARSEQVLGAPIPQRKILDDQGERERAQELEQLRRPVKAPQQRYLGGGAEGADRDRGGGRAPPEAQASREA